MTTMMMVFKRRDVTHLLLDAHRQTLLLLHVQGEAVEHVDELLLGRGLVQAREPLLPLLLLLQLTTTHTPHRQAPRVIKVFARRQAADVSS